MDANEFRTVGHRVIDLLSEYLASVEHMPLSTRAQPAELRALFDEPLPKHGIGSDTILRELKEKLASPLRACEPPWVLRPHHADANAHRGFLEISSPPHSIKTSGAT